MKKETRKKLIEEILGTELREFEQCKAGNFIDFYVGSVVLTTQSFRELVDVLGENIKIDAVSDLDCGIFVSIDDVDFSIKKPRVVTAHGD